jgi:predicted dienelactone hydrolase
MGVTLTATSVSNHAISASVTVTVPAIEVHVSAAESLSLAAGATIQLTGNVSYDPANKGVTWVLQCSAATCGTIAPLSSASGQPVTYTAPGTPPSADMQVTATARSISAPSVQWQVTITVKAVTVAFKPVSALIPLSGTQQFTANVGFDPTASGVSWQLLQAGAPCPNTCGAVSPLVTANGAAVTYTAPATLPANTIVTLKATSVTENSSAASGTVIVSKGSVQLAPVDMSFFKVRRYGGPTPPQSPPPQIATMTNTGHATLTISNISIGGTGAAQFSQTNTCGSVLPPGASCSITVTFRWAPGTFAAVLPIVDSSNDSPQTITLAGNAQASVAALVHAALIDQTVLVAPRPTGASAVGTREIYLLDAQRMNPYVANGTRRELMVRFWYPATTRGATATCTSADYTSPQTWSYFGTLLGVTLPHVVTNSCRNAAVASGRHPVVLLSPGYTGTATDYTFLAEDLASRGYVVASAGHTNEATAVAFPDGRLEKSVFGSYLTDDWVSDPGTLGFAVAVRLADLRFIIDELAVFDSERDSDFAGRLDLYRIAVIGHSLGGLTAIRALESEPRVKAAVLLDAVVPPRLATPLQQPVLNLVVGRQWNETDCNLWGSLTGARVAVDFPAADHLALSDAVWLLKGSVASGSTPHTMIAATRAYVAAFLDGNLGGKDLRSLLARIAAAPAGAVVADASRSLCTQP